MNKIEWCEKIRQAEIARDFSRQLRVVPPEKYDKLTSNFVYIKKDPVSRFIQILLRGLSLGVMHIWNKIFHAIKIKGRKNLKSIKSAIVTCNHVDSLDCMMVKSAVFGHKLYITVAEFNNRKGIFGELLRAGGILPFSENPKCMQNLSTTISGLLSRDRYVLFYPEGALWKGYEKPRYTQSGAYHYAVKNNVPIVPIFITFKELNRFQKLYRKNKTFVINILEPIYPKENMTKRENLEYLQKMDYEKRIEFYEKYYNKKMEYLPHVSLPHMKSLWENTAFREMETLNQEQEDISSIRNRI